MAGFRPSVLLRDPALAGVEGLRVAAVRGEADVDDRRLLRDLLDFDAAGRSALVSFDRLVENGEFSAAENLLEALSHGTERTAEAELRGRENQLAAARAEVLREFAEQARFEVERVRALGADVPPAIDRAATEVTDTARQSREVATARLGALRRLAEQHMATQRDALRARVAALEVQGSQADLVARARAALDRDHLDVVQALLEESASTAEPALDALSVPRPRPWIESTSLQSALEWLTSASAPPGFLDRWRPVAGDAAAWEAVNALCALFDAWPPTPDAFHRFAAALDRLLGGTGDVARPIAAEGALSVRVPALTRPDMPWFRPAAQPGGLLLILPAVSSAGVPASVGPEEPVFALRLREALQTDRRAIRIEGAQLIPLLSDAYRRVNVWRLLGARTPLPLALTPPDGMLADRDGIHWTPAPDRVRHVTRTVMDFLALDTAPTLVDGLVQMSGGVPVLGLALVEALLAVVQDRTTGRADIVDVGDLRAAFWHDLYLPRVWSLCLGPLEADREAQAAFAAMRCACGSRVESRFTVPVDEVIEWAEMAGLGASATRAALGRLRALGLLELQESDLGDVVAGQRTGLALIVARKQGPADEVLTSMTAGHVPPSSR